MLINEVRPLRIDTQKVGQDALHYPDWRLVNDSRFPSFVNYNSDYIASRALTIISLVPVTAGIGIASNFEVKINAALKKLDKHDWDEPFGVSLMNYYDQHYNGEKYIAGEENYVARIRKMYRHVMDKEVFATNSLIYTRNSPSGEDPGKFNILFANVTKIENAGGIRRNYLFNGKIEWEKLTEYWISPVLMNPKDAPTKTIAKVGKVFRLQILPQLLNSGFRVEVVPQDVINTLMYNEASSNQSFSITKMKQEAIEIASSAMNDLLISSKENFRALGVTETSINRNYLQIYRDRIAEQIRSQQQYLDSLEVPEDIGEEEFAPLPIPENPERVHQGILGQIQQAEARGEMGPSTFEPLTVEQMNEIMEQLTAEPAVRRPDPRPFGVVENDAATAFGWTEMVAEQLRQVERREAQEAAEHEARERLIRQYPLTPDQAEEIANHRLGQALDIDTGQYITDPLIITHQMSFTNEVISNNENAIFDEIHRLREEVLPQLAGIPAGSTQEVHVETQQTIGEGGVEIRMRMENDNFRGLNLDSLRLDTELTEAATREMNLTPTENGDNNPAVSRRDTNNEGW